MSKPDNKEDLADSPDTGGDALSAELEQALQDATDSFDANRAKADSAGPDGDKPSADKMIIEALSAELADLKGEHEAKLAELAEINDRSLRQQAEFENFRRRGLKERQEAHQFGHQNLVKDLLATVDNLERALEHAEGSEGGNLEALLQGVNLVLRELMTALQKHNVVVVESQDQSFDPSIHEAVGQIPDASQPANTVAHVLQKGYKLHDRMLRPARVMVTFVPDEAEESQAQTIERVDVASHEPDEEEEKAE